MEIVFIKAVISMRKIVEIYYQLWKLLISYVQNAGALNMLLKFVMMAMLVPSDVVGILL